MPVVARPEKKIRSARGPVSLEKPVARLPKVAAKPAGRGKGQGVGAYGRAEANVGRCAVCGRSDAPLRAGQAGLGFHYSPIPCELPCAGGPVGTPEDHSHGIHSERCPNCSLVTTA